MKWWSSRGCMPRAFRAVYGTIDQPRGGRRGTTLKAGVSFPQSRGTWTTSDPEERPGSTRRADGASIPASQRQAGAGAHRTVPASRDDAERSLRPAGRRHAARRAAQSCFQVPSRNFAQSGLDPTGVHNLEDPKPEFQVRRSLLGCPRLTNA
jgi:hypothetical protein